MNGGKIMVFVWIRLGLVVGVIGGIVFKYITFYVDGETNTTGVTHFIVIFTFLPWSGTKVAYL